MRVFRTMLLVAVAFTASACSDVFGPWGTSGFYDLRLVNGDRVPAVVFSRVGDNPLRITLVGGDLRLRDDHTFRLELTYEEDDGRSETRYTQGISGEWERDHDSVWLDFLDPETGEWSTLVANRLGYELEVTIPGAFRGMTMRAVFER